MLKEYRKTATIKAEQFDGSKEMIDKYHIEYDEAYILPFRIETIEGWLGMKAGDWIAANDDGKYWPIADDVFKKTYEEVEDTPPRKYKVWISSPDNNSFNEEDEFEVTNESEEEIEQIAKDFAFEHIEWGYEEFKGEVEDE